MYTKKRIHRDYTHKEPRIAFIRMVFIFRFRETHALFQFWCCIDFRLFTQKPTTTKLLWNLLSLSFYSSFVSSYTLDIIGNFPVWEVWWSYCHSLLSTSIRILTLFRQIMILFDLVLIDDEPKWFSSSK